jgi:hypothetical protein
MINAVRQFGHHPFKTTQNKRSLPCSLGLRTCRLSTVICFDDNPKFQHFAVGHTGRATLKLAAAMEFSLPTGRNEQDNSSIADH